MNKRRLAPAALFLCALAVLAQTPAPLPSADPQRYLADIQSLSSPVMEGRGNGTEGLTRAAHLIETRYRSLGLQPAGNQGYLQPFTVTTGARLGSGNRLLVTDPDAREPTGGYLAERDFVPLAFSASGAVSAPVVFAGYGISAPEFHYDDYAGADAKDRIVLVLRGEPAGFSAHGNHGTPGVHAQLFTKAINARNHGAKAVLLVNGNFAEHQGDTLLALDSLEGPEDVGIPFLQVRNTVADALLKTGHKSVAELQKQIDGATQPASFQLPANARVSLEAALERMHATIHNVLAYLPGKSDEYIIVGAHYDHLGRGDSHSLAPSQIGQIHPGADDNASGTAGVLELARLFAGRKGQLDRGILFASFAGEELGLLGSAAWVKDPTRPLEKAVAMLNMDMIGRIKDGNVYIGGVGTGSSFKQILEEAEARTSFHYQASPGGYSSSDHTSFVAKHIPVLFFFSGLHGDYHKPSDTWEKIDAAAAAHLLDLVSNVAFYIDAARERPSFVTVEESPGAQAAGTPGAGGGYGPYFGSIPDFGETESGVRFSDVRPGSPAAKAGLRAGDILVEFGDKHIKNLYDFTDALRRSKVGDTVEVVVLRGDRRLTASVTLEARK